MEAADEAARVAALGRRRLSTVSWIIYDLANTIFSLNIVSLYFSLWVVNVMGGKDVLYGNANSLSMALVLVTAPLAGALSDQLPRRVPLLIASTLICITLTLFLGSTGLMASLVIFVAATYFYEVGLIFYDSLLPEVSDEHNRGRIGGIGIGVGYLGSVVGLGTGLVVLHLSANDYPLVFKCTAVLFLLFALPAFVFIRERPRRVTRRGLFVFREAFAELHVTLQRARSYPDIGRFLVGRVFYADAANTLIVFMGIFVTNELGFSATQAQVVLLIGILTAVVGGIAWGFVVDRIGPKRALDYILGLWMIVLTLAAAIPLLHWPSQLFWLVAAVAGMTLGGTWAADRPYMLRLAPPRYIGQFYGLYSMVGRFSSVIGPLLWGIIVNRLGWGRPIAVLSLVVMIVISFAILRGVSDRRREWSVADLPQ